MDRHFLLKEIFYLEKDCYGFWPRYKSMEGFHEDWNSKMELLSKVKLKKNNNYDFIFMHEYLKYSLKTYRNGEYFSTIFLKSLMPRELGNRSPSSLLNYILHRDITLDTLMGFNIMRARIEELTLNLYFYFKAKNLIKNKSWFDLFKLVLTINYSNYENEIGLKIRKKDRSFRIFLEKFVKKNKKLHTEEIKKYVLNQKSISDNFRPSFYMPPPEERLSIKKQYKLKLGKYDRTVDKFKNYSLKPLDELYTLLSNELHPNNLFLRNISTSTKIGSVENAIILKNHLEKLHICSEFITDVSEIVYKKNIEIIEFFLQKINGSKEDRLVLEGFNQSVKNNLKK